jgi:hypothetical protein
LTRGVIYADSMMCVDAWLPCSYMQCIDILGVMQQNFSCFTE